MSLSRCTLVFNVVLAPILRREPLRRSSGGTERARQRVPRQEMPKVKQIGVEYQSDHRTLHNPLSYFFPPARRYATKAERCYHPFVARDSDCATNPLTKPLSDTGRGRNCDASNRSTYKINQATRKRHAHIFMSPARVIDIGTYTERRKGEDSCSTLTLGTSMPPLPPLFNPFLPRYPFSFWTLGSAPLTFSETYVPRERHRA